MRFWSSAGGATQVAGDAVGIIVGLGSASIEPAGKSLFGST